MTNICGNTCFRTHLSARSCFSFSFHDQYVRIYVSGPIFLRISCFSLYFQREVKSWQRKRRQACFSGGSARPFASSLIRSTAIAETCLIHGIQAASQIVEQIDDSPMQSMTRAFRTIAEFPIKEEMSTLELILGLETI